MAVEPPDTPPKPVRSDRQQQARIVAVSVLGGLVALFAALNSQSVKIDWLVTTTSMPLILAIVLCAAIGVAVGWLVATHRGSRK